MKFTRRADGVIVNEQGDIATAEMLKAEGIDPSVLGNQQPQQPQQPNQQETQNRIIELERQLALANQKANDYDTLIRSPEFQQFARGISSGQQPQQPNNQINTNEMFAGYEDREALVDLATNVADLVEARVTQKLLPEMEKMTAERFQPLFNDMAETRQKAEFDALVQQAQTNNWSVDPSSIKGEIDHMRQRLPNLSMVQAYDIVKSDLERRGLVTKPPIQQQELQNADNIQEQIAGNPLIQPVSSGASTLVGNKGNKLDDTMSELHKAKGGEQRRSIQEIVHDAASQVEQSTGQTIDRTML